jgi:hypothetical protein
VLTVGLFSEPDFIKLERIALESVTSFTWGETAFAQSSAPVAQADRAAVSYSDISVLKSS